jgi:nitroreductase
LVEERLQQRRSTRGYLPDAVPQSDVARILTAARRAPSGANLQPGKFHVLAGAPLRDLSRRLIAASAEERAQVSEYSYFPQPMSPALKAKQRAAGFALYDALGVSKRDLAGRRAQFDRNYAFFDAPVGIIVTIARDMGHGCFMDLGMSLMALQLAADDLGYGTCGIGALANYGDLIAEHLALSAGEMVVCGLALGRADPNSAVNTVRTERDTLTDFASFKGFEG